MSPELPGNISPGGADADASGLGGHGRKRDLFGTKWRTGAIHAVTFQTMYYSASATSDSYANTTSC